MNFNTTVGRFVISVGFAVAATAVNMAVAFVAKNPDFFTPTTVLFVNAVLFAVKNALDKDIKNV